MEVGVRELRNNLSRYLERVRDGEELGVTVRGQTIARILPTNGDRVLDRLIAEGRLTPAKYRDRDLPPSIKAQGTVSDLVSDQRR